MKAFMITAASSVLFALPLVASAQGYYYAPNYSYGPQYQPVVVYAPQVVSTMGGMQQQQQQQQMGGYAMNPSVSYPGTYGYGYQPYQVGQVVPNYGSIGGGCGLLGCPGYMNGGYGYGSGGYSTGYGYGAYNYGSPAPGAYGGPPNPYLDQGYFTGNYDTFQSPICYFPSYGAADCGYDPRQPVYDVWSGTYY